MEWILASASPRRKELFAEIIPTFEVIPATGEEILPTGTKVNGGIVTVLARKKAEEVCALERARGKAVLGADTLVILDGEVFGKPKDEADAVRMLTALSGRTHEVYTGICIKYPLNEEQYKTRFIFDCTKVTFYPLTQEQIRDYVATGSPMDKAGAYGIQDGGLVEKIEGSYSNVVGLPIERCKELIAAMERHVHKVNE